MLYEINKKAEATVDTTVGQTESINMKEIVKPGSIFGPIMCWATTSKVNKIGEVQYSYRKIDTGMSVYMDDIGAAGEIAEIRKGIRNCARLEKEKTVRYGLKKTKYMMVKTGKEREGARNQVGEEEVWVKLKLFDTCLMVADIRNGNMDKYKVSEIREIG